MKTKNYLLFLAILFSIYSNAAPVCTAESEPNNTSGTALLLNLGLQNVTMVCGDINPGGDLDFFQINGVAPGSRIWLVTDPGGLQNAGATSRDLVMDVLASDGTTVIENDDDDGTGNGGDGTVETGLASTIGGRTLVVGGTYYIKLSAFSPTGIVNPYRLFVVVTNSAATPEVESNNTSATANAILNSSTPTALHSGAINAAGDVDYYSVVIDAGNILVVNVDADPERDGTGTDLVVEVRDATDVLLLSFDSSITGSLANPACESANYSITSSGIYYIKVRHFSATGTGTYHLMAAAAEAQIPSPIPVCTADAEPNNTSGTAQLLDLGLQNVTMVCGDINPGGDFDFFQINGVVPGSRIWLVTDPGGIQNAGATSRDLVMDVLAADGTTVLENDDDDGTGNGGDGTNETGLASGIGGLSLTAGGTYFIKLRAFNPTGIVNPYKLFIVVSTISSTPEVESNNTLVTANTLIGAPQLMGIAAGTIGAAGDVDYFSVNVLTGNILVVDVDADPERDGTGTDLVVEVRDATDVILFSFDSSITGSLANPASESANYNITSGGTYYIKVRHFSATGTGTYHIMASAANGPVLPSCILTCPANITQNNDPNQCGAVVTYPAPTTTGSCGTVTCSPASGSFFPVGTTTITCTSTNGGLCTFTVTVVDNQNPVITPCPADVYLCGGSQVVNYSAPSGSDNCPGVTLALTNGLASGSVFPVGTTTNTFTLTDASLNSVSCSFNVTVFDDPTPIISSNTGSFKFCKNSYLILDAGSYVGYLWSTGATTQTIATSSGSTFTVTVTDGNGCTGSTSETTIRVLATPSRPGTISGPVNGLCNSSGNIYFISPVVNTDYYLWTVTNGIITSGQGTTSIEVDYLGFSSSTITVRAQNACGNSSSRSLTVYAKPASPLTIHGNKYGVCKLAGEKYSVDLIDGAAIYRWTVPSGVMITSGQGTPAIEVTFGSSFSSGSICCRAENACGNSSWTCMNVHAKAQKPVIIIGPTSVCRHQPGVVYSTPSVYGATSYIWGVPSGAIIQSGQGTPSITVKFGTHSGNVDVKAKNSCGSSSDYDLYVRIVCRESGDFTMGEVNVYPNPANTNMNVSITSDLSQKCVIRMIDLVGKQLMMDAVELAEGNNLLQYDVSGYAKGLYFLVLEREGMPAETIRVVVE